MILVVCVMIDSENTLFKRLIVSKPFWGACVVLVFLIVATQFVATSLHTKTEETATQEDVFKLPETVGFNRDIRPVFSENCFACHGPDKAAQKGKFGLHVFEEATSTLKSGVTPIVPGDPGASAVIGRITHRDPNEVMPPPSTEKKLTARQIALIERWITQGATYEPHWAYIPPKKADLQHAEGSAEAPHPIDRLIREKLKAADLSPSKEADRRTLIRRVSLDLIGLPPEPKEIQAFLDDQSPNAYERLVDRLLSSPHFGERFALQWLDLVRYADTNGFHADVDRHLWPYRDYVIKAFNENKPFDEFTIEQLAGDLLPNAGEDQIVASTYNNLNKITEESGAQAKEYIAKSLSDRVATLGTAWMGSTVGCAECHDHKFDPFTQTDFYALGAFFADIQDAGVWTGYYIRLHDNERYYFYPGPEEKRKKINEARATYIAAWDEEEKHRNAANSPEQLDAIVSFDNDWLSIMRDQLKDRESAWEPLPMRTANSDIFALTVKNDAVLNRTWGGIREDGTFEAHGDLPLRRLSALRLDFLSQEEENGLGNAKPGDAPDVAASIDGMDIFIISPDGQRRKAKIDYSTFKEDVTEPVNRLTRAEWIPNFDRLRETSAEAPYFEPAFRQLGPRSELQDKSWVIVLEEPLDVQQGSTFHIRIRTVGGDTFPSFKLSGTRIDSPGADPDKLSELLKFDSQVWTNENKSYLRNYVIRYSPEFVARARKFYLADRAFMRLHWWSAKTRATKAVAPRIIRLLPRGDWMNETGPIVEPAVPAFLGTVRSTGDRRLTRLDLAQWLTSRDNPLTARVFVNRLWSQFFGQGLSDTLEDMGSQGEWPRHPEMLDWLAVEFMNSGWDIKHIVRLIMTSETYRQSSMIGPAGAEKDPQNHYFSRQVQIRLPAEIIRDNALAISGLLNRKLGGPGVYLYDSDGSWGDIPAPSHTRGHRSFNASDLYRRAVYTHWQRTDLHPSLNVFGAPPREMSVARRAHSNTPLQALALLNDPTHVEAARAFGTQMALRAQTKKDLEEAIAWAFERATGRRPTNDSEIPLLLALRDESLTHFRAHPEEADKLLRVGQKPMPDEMDPVTLAAWATVARAILNLHETITRF